jgi:hypothetical protein
MIGRLFASMGMKLLGFTQLVSLGLIALLLIAKGAETRRALKWEMRAQEEISANAVTLARVKQASFAARAGDAATVIRVERDQNAYSQETDRDYQAQLAALRRRYDALRMRTDAAPAHPGGSGSTAMPDLPGAACSLDAAAAQAGLPPEDALIATSRRCSLRRFRNGCGERVRSSADHSISGVGNRWSNYRHFGYFSLIPII